MHIDKIKAIVEKHKGSIKSFKMLSGRNLDPPFHVIKQICSNGTLVFSVNDGSQQYELETSPEFVEAICYFPKK